MCPVFHRARFKGRSELLVDGASAKGQEYGIFRVVWLSDFRADLHAGAAVLRRARQPHLLPHAAPRRQHPHQAAALVPARRARGGAQRDRQGLRVSQGRVRHHRARRDQEDRAQDRQGDGDPGVRQGRRGRPDLLRVVLLPRTRKKPGAGPMRCLRRPWKRPATSPSPSSPCTTASTRSSCAPTRAA